MQYRLCLIVLMMGCDDEPAFVCAGSLRQKLVPMPASGSFQTASCITFDLICPQSG
jgi:hypothetical protein